MTIFPCHHPISRIFPKQKPTSVLGVPMATGTAPHGQGGSTAGHPELVLFFTASWYVDLATAFAVRSRRVSVARFGRPSAQTKPPQIMHSKMELTHDFRFFFFTIQLYWGTKKIQKEHMNISSSMNHAEQILTGHVP